MAIIGFLSLCGACDLPTYGGGAGDATPLSDGGVPPAPDLTPVAEPCAPIPAAPQPLTCPVTVRLAGQKAGAQVFIAGEWNGWNPTAQRLTEAPEGGLRVELQLPPGLHGYKLVVDGDWRLDPGGQDGFAYRKYVDGTENSALRVRDCGKPALRAPAGGASTSRPAAGQGTFEAQLSLQPNYAGQALCGVSGELRALGEAPRPLRSGADGELQLGPDGRSVRVRVSGLPDGKYTVRVTPASGGVEGEPLLLPFWIEAQPFTVRDTPLYMIVTDRFKDAVPANNPAPPMGVRDAARYQGGDLQGVEEQIRAGYFDARGIKALWLTPFYTQPAGSYLDQSGKYQVTAYHGYWPTRGREVDPRIGGPDALRSLVREAHRHGIRVLMDAVLNHVHEDHEYFKDPSSRGWFRTGCQCGTPGCDWTEKRLSCLFTSYMPDIDWTVTAASERFIADALYWLEEYDLDGLRIDAVKHVEDLAVVNLGARVRERFEQGGNRLYLVGETAMGWSDSGVAGNRNEYDTIKRYMGPGMLDGQFDFVWYHAVPYRVFARDAPNRRFQHLDFWTRASLDEFKGFDMVKFIGAHDNTRFVTLASYRGQSAAWPTDKADHKWEDLPAAPPDQEPYDRLFLALANLLTTPGVPLLYYGDEYGEYGGGDPDNRHAMRFSGRSALEEAQDARTTALLKARAALAGLRRGDKMPVALLEEDLYAYARIDADPAQSALVVENRLDQAKDVMIPVPAELGWATGAALKDHLSGADQGSAGSALALRVPPRGVLIIGRK